MGNALQAAFRLGFLFAVIALLVSHPAVAATSYNFVGSGSNLNWRDTANWNPNTGFPGSGVGDTAIINPSVNITLDGAISIAAFQPNGTGLTISGNTTGAASFTVTNTVPARTNASIDLTSTGGAFDSSYILGPAITTYENGSTIRLLPGTGGARTITVTNFVTNGSELDVNTDGFVGKVGSGTLQNGTIGAGIVTIAPGAKLSTNQYLQQGTGITTLGGSLDVLTGPITLNGGTIRGDGVLNDPLSSTNTIIRPRANIPANGFYVDIGNLTVAGNAALGNNSRIDTLLGAGGTAGRLNVQGNLDLTGANTMLTLNGGDAGITYVVATYTGTLTDTFDTVSPGFTIDYSHLGEIRVTGIPEPTGLVAMSLALMITLPRRRRTA